MTTDILLTTPPSFAEDPGTEQERNRPGRRETDSPLVVV
jgi:hypothetical protein